MDIEFDNAKDALNQQKHGLSLDDAKQMEWAAAQMQPDQRRDYGEARIIAVGPIGSRLHVLVFTVRGDKLRVISLRKANQQEYDEYERNQA